MNKSGQVVHTLCTFVTICEQKCTHCDNSRARVNKSGQVVYTLCTFVTICEQKAHIVTTHVRVCTKVGKLFTHCARVNKSGQVVHTLLTFVTMCEQVQLPYFLTYLLGNRTSRES